MKKKKVRRVFGLAFLNLAFMILCFVGLLPILYALLLSVSEGASALSSGLFTASRGFTLENYRSILVEEPFLRWLFNSVILSVGTMVVAMACSVVAAYAFSRYRFRGRMQALRGLLVLNAFPQILTMFAVFRLFLRSLTVDNLKGFNPFKMCHFEVNVSFPCHIFTASLTAPAASSFSITTWL